MAVDTEVRGLLQDYAGRIEVGGLVDAPGIQIRAKKRGHRRRAFGGLATLVVAFVLVAGVGTALRSPDENTVFAGNVELAEGQELQPSNVVFDGDRFVGIAPTDSPAVWDSENQQFVLVESDDGSSWKQVAEKISFRATSVTLALHDGEYVVVATRRLLASTAARTPQFELSASRSSNLGDWSSSSQILDDEIVPAGGEPWLSRTVAANAGLLTQLTITEARRNVEDEVAGAGYDPDALCEMGGTAQQLSFRVCGTSERVKLRRTTDDSAGIFDFKLLFAPTNDDFDIVELPESSQRPGGPGFIQIYPTSSGFGLSGVEALESTNGVTWTVADTAQDIGPMIAARGDETVLALPFGMGQHGPDSPVMGFAYRNGDEEWLRLDLGWLYSEGRSPRWLTGLQAGPGGWVMVAQQSFGLRQSVEGVERNRSGASDFVLTNDGYVLEGRHPFGPATLKGRDGAVLRDWDHFETTRPAWSGMTVTAEGVWLADEVTGEPTAVFSFEQWSALLDPLGYAEYDLLFSADGQQWQILDTGSSLPQVLAIGEDAVVVTRLPSHHIHPTNPILESIALPQSNS